MAEEKDKAGGLEFEDSTEQPEGEQPQAGGKTTAEGQPDFSTVDDDSVRGHKVYKELQGEFTKRSQRLSELERQMEQATSILNNPDPHIERYLAQRGMRMVPVQQQTEEQYGQEGQPDIRKLIEQAIDQRMGTQLEPLAYQMQNLVMTQVMTELNSEFPDWLKYEKEVKDNLKKFPTLAYDIKKLYKLSVPDDVIEARLYKKKQEELARKEKLGVISGGGGRSPKQEPAEEKTAGNWEKSWEYAKRRHGVQFKE